MRTIPTRTRAGILTGCLALVLTGCSGEQREYAIPEKLCGVPAPKDALSPLLPPGKNLEQEGAPLVDARTFCRTVVDR
ncbi:MAG TPA: hypothetical protein VFY14_22535, partial [Streptomyces sp.]|nr:hypothetical protein [Streptomyces sp.]